MKMSYLVLIFEATPLLNSFTAFFIEGTEGSKISFEKTITIVDNPQMYLFYNFH